jgi:PAS domain S-box-containing protein
VSAVPPGSPATHEAQEIFEAYPAATVIVDGDGRLLALNRAARTMLGHEGSVGPLLMKRGGEVLHCLHAFGPGGCGRQDACSDCVIRGSVRRALAEGRPQQARGLLQMRTDAGDSQAWMLVGAAPLSREDGGRVLLTLQDISDVARASDDLARAEQARQENELLYRSLFELAPSSVVLISPEGALLEFNEHAHRSLGYSREELARLRLSDIDREEGPEGVRQHVEQIIAQGQAEFPARHVTKDGAVRDVEVRARPLTVRGSNRVLAAWRDVTERKQAEDKVRASRAELRALLGRLESIREEEKTRIARDLHDEMGQLLTALRMDVEAVEEGLGDLPAEGTIPALLDRAVAAAELAGQTIQAMQRVAASLRPVALDRLGLGPALRQEGRAFQARTGVTCQVQLAEDLVSLGPDLDTALFRIVQEALTNVARHAHASRVAVILQRQGPDVLLRVEDDGRGLDAAGPPQRALGVVGMRERTERLGGDLVLEARPQGGTVVRARLPLSPPPGAP